MQMLNYLGSTIINGAAVPQVVSALFPLPVTLSGGIGGLAVAGVQPAGAVVTENPVMVGGVDGGGIIRNLLTDVTGVLQVNATLAGGSITVVQPTAANLNAQVVGNVASAAADAGNPVKVAAVYNTTPATYTTGQRADLQAGTRGSVNVSIFAQDSVNGWSFMTTFADGQSQARTGGFVAAYNYVYNGASSDRLTKPRTAYRLPSSLASNNAANIKATPGTVFSISANVTLAASTCYLKLFDTTGVPNPAAINPLYLWALNIVDGQVSFNLPGQGIYFPTGIGLAVVANPADLDNTAVAAGQVTALQVIFA